MANFVELNSIEKLEELFEKSNETPVVLFKHSITCPISTSVYYEVADVQTDVNLINMPATSMVPALLQGQVDAILGSIDAYQIQAESQGAQLDVYRFADHGVPTVSTSIFASDEYLKSNPEVVKKFIAASLKGWSFALDHPDQAIKDLKKVFPEVNEKLATAELAAITPLFCSGGAKYIGKAEDALWTKSQQLLSEVKLLPAGQDPKSYYSSDFLPPASSMRACKS